MSNLRNRWKQETCLGMRDRRIEVIVLQKRLPQVKNVPNSITDDPWIDPSGSVCVAKIRIAIRHLLCRG